MTPSPSPARGIGFVEAFRSRELVTVRIRAGRGRAHRYPTHGFGSHNPDRIVIRCKYSSATDDSSRVGRDGWPGMRVPFVGAFRALSGLTRISRIWNFLDRRQKVHLLLLATSRWQRVVRYSRCTLNFCRVLPDWSFGALAQPAKQSSRRFTKCFDAFSAVVAHERNHAAKARPDVGYE